MKRYIITVATASISVLLLSGCSMNFPFELNFLKQKEQKEAVDTQIENEEIVNNEPDKTEEPPRQEAKNEWSLAEEYFTETELQDGLKVILNPENILALVNKEVNLPSTYIPQDLVAPNVSFSFGEADLEKRYIRKDAAVALEKLFNEAKKQNIELFALSGYRSYERQDIVFHSYVESNGLEYAEKISAYPGQSEHQTGLAMDITSKSVDLTLTQDFGETPEGMWVKDHAHEFGFIIRYPKGKESITGYTYEPWHLRFVGVDIATIIYENKLTLEEFFEKVTKI